eukprot:3087154-Amphidinium_carterae.1
MESIDIKPVEGGEAESEAVQWREAVIESASITLGGILLSNIGPSRTGMIPDSLDQFDQPAVQRLH